MATKTLSKNIINTEVKNHELLKLAYDAYLANSRSAKASTLRRGEVRGGGKKPWKQKGTGRARFGSTRNPIWRHGGVAHGPIGEANFSKNINKVAKRIALVQALSLQNKDKKIVSVADFKPTNGKTKEAIEFLNGNKLDIASNKVLFVVNEKTDENLRATNNLPNVKLIKANYLNVFDLLNADKIAIEESAIATINEWLGGEDA